MTIGPILAAAEPHSRSSGTDERDPVISPASTGPTSRDQRLDLSAEKVPRFPIMYGPTIAVHSYRLQGFEPTAIGFPRFSELDVNPE